MASKKARAQYGSLQPEIDRVYDPQLDEGELLLLLRHPSGLVRLNAIRILPCRKILNEAAVVEALTEVSQDARSSFKFFAINIRQFAIATLTWLESDLASRAFDAIWQTLSDDDRFFVDNLVREMPKLDLYEEHRIVREAGFWKDGGSALAPVSFDACKPKVEE